MIHRPGHGHFVADAGMPVRHAQAALRVAGTAVVAGVGTVICAALTDRLGPRRPSGWVRDNYRGRPVALTGGWSAAAGSVIAAASCAGPRGRAAVFIAGGAAAAAGAYDDLVAPRRELGADKGWAGHVRALRAGRVSGGVVKVAVIGSGALVAGRLVSTSWPVAVPRAALIAGAANLVNLFDLRPGRAGKVVLIGALTQLGGPGALVAAATGGAVAAELPADLGETWMLGDLGANTLGALLGLSLAVRDGFTPWAALGVVGALTALSERVSFSRIIDSTPPLRAIDQWGRRPGPSVGQQRPL